MEEEAPPIIYETDKPKEDDNEINFIKEVKIKQENEEYNIKFGLKGNDLIFKVISESSKEIIHYQQDYSLCDVQQASIFSGYNNMNDIINVLKGLKFEIEKKNDELTIRFSAFMPNGQIKSIRFHLPKYILNDREMVKYAFEEIISIKINMKNKKEKYNEEKIKNENEIKKLKEDISKAEAKISKLELDNKNYKDENEKLWEEINKIKSDNNNEQNLNLQNNLNNENNDNNDNRINIDNSQNQIDENINFQNINGNQKYQQNDYNDYDDYIDEDNINNYNDLYNNNINNNNYRNNNNKKNNKINNSNKIDDNSKYFSFLYDSRKKNSLNQKKPRTNIIQKKNNSNPMNYISQMNNSKPREIDYSFQILETNDETYTKIIYSENEIVNLEFTIINKSAYSFPGNTKLIFFKNNITNIKEYYLRSLKPGQNEKVKINFPENLFFGSLNKIKMGLEVGGKILQNSIDFTVINKSLAIKEFRQQYNSNVVNYSDEDIFNSLKIYDCNLKYAYDDLISKMNNQYNQYIIRSKSIL